MRRGGRYFSFVPFSQQVGQSVSSGCCVTVLGSLKVVFLIAFRRWRGWKTREKEWVEGEEGRGEGRGERERERGGIRLDRGLAQSTV
ncbi:MAG: hypothetical protein ACKESB_03335 [Candidatus Hodgkinia cicadicola]